VALRPEIALAKVRAKVLAGVLAGVFFWWVGAAAIAKAVELRWPQRR
jgi:hypothetical protein